MRYAAGQRRADLPDEYSAAFPADGVFTLLGRHAGPAVFQLLARHKRNAALQLHTELGKLPFHLIQRAAHGMHDVLHGLFQVSLRAVLAQDDLFPVPLVHINRVQIVQRLVAANGVHIRHKPVAGEKVVLVQRKALPFRQRVHHLGGRLHRRDIERHRALHTCLLYTSTCAMACTCCSKSR